MILRISKLFLRNSMKEQFQVQSYLVVTVVYITRTNYMDILHISNDSTLRRVILFEAHDSPTAGHLGYAKTLNAIRKSYHWSGLQGKVLCYVRQCLSY